MILKNKQFALRNKHYKWTNKYPLRLDINPISEWGIHLKIDTLFIQPKMIAKNRIVKFINQ